MWKMSSEESFFPEMACQFFLFLDLCHLLAMYYKWVLLKQKVVHCVLSFWLFFVSFFLCYAYIEVTCWCFYSTFEFLQTEAARCDSNWWAHHTQLDFSLGYWTLVVKYKANYFGRKIANKVFTTHKIDDSNL